MCFLLLHAKTAGRIWMKFGINQFLCNGIFGIMYTILTFYSFGIHVNSLEFIW